jgi:hypothetical protein
VEVRLSRQLLILGLNFRACELLCARKNSIDVRRVARYVPVVEQERSRQLQLAALGL